MIPQSHLVPPSRPDNDHWTNFLTPPEAPPLNLPSRPFFREHDHQSQQKVRYNFVHAARLFAYATPVARATSESL